MRMFSFRIVVFLLMPMLTTLFSVSAQQLQSFHLKNVKLLPGAFYDAQQTDMKYMLSLDVDRLLAPYRKAANLPPVKPNYENWENTGLDGHIGGHYLSALSFMYIATGNPELNQRLDYMLAELKSCQDKIGTGYIGGTPGGEQLWNEIAQGKIVTDTFAINGKWVPLYNLHKLLSGLNDAYSVAGKGQAKSILIRLVDFIDSVSTKLSDEQIQKLVFSEHGGLNEVFANLSEITGDKKYLTLADRFSQRLLLDPLSNKQDKLTGLHANMQIPQVVGFQRIAEVGGGASFGEAARFFWETVVKNRSVVIGGNSVQEHFNPPSNYMPMITSIAGPETCNTYNMLKLTRHLFEQSGGTQYLDYYERAVYNHILSSQHPNGGFVYYTSMRPQHYRVYSHSQKCMWCCVGSGMENHGKYGEMIYSHRDDDLFVNLFMASTLSWPEKNLKLSQQTKFPDEEVTRLVMDDVGKKAMNIHIRHPKWVASGKLEISVNGKPVPVSGYPGRYVKIARKWKRGDVIEVKLPMSLSMESLPDGSDFVAFLHGPIVLAAKTSTEDLDNLVGDEDQWGGYRAKGKQYSFDTMPVLSKTVSDPVQYLKPVAGKPQTFTASDLIVPVKFKSLELMPFYKLHDARYMIYWKVGE